MLNHTEPYCVLYICVVGAADPASEAGGGLAVGVPETGMGVAAQGAQTVRP